MTRGRRSNSPYLWATALPPGGHLIRAIDRVACLLDNSECRFSTAMATCQAIRRACSILRRVPTLKHPCICTTCKQKKQVTRAINIPPDQTKNEEWCKFYPVEIHLIVRPSSAFKTRAFRQ